MVFKAMGLNEMISGVNVAREKESFKLLQHVQARKTRKTLKISSWLGWEDNQKRGESQSK